MKTLIALAGLALCVAPAFAQSPVKVAAACCPCGGGCTCAVGTCPGGCPDALSPVQTFLPVPGGKAFASPCPGGVCPTGGCAVAGVASSSASCASCGPAGAAGASFFTTGGHPVLSRVAAPLGRLRGFLAGHRLFGRCR